MGTDIFGQLFIGDGITMTRYPFLVYIFGGVMNMFLFYNFFVYKVIYLVVG